MKIALLLSSVCATAILSGCSTPKNAGGASEPPPEYMYGSGVQTSPAVTDPSLPQDPYAGPAIPPPR